MLIEDIKNKTQDINELGHYIIKMGNVIFTLPQHLQSEYAGQLLDVIFIFYDRIEELKKDIIKYKELENNEISFTIRKLEKDLYKFQPIWKQ